MLMQIRDYCAQRGLVSLHDLTLHFQIEAEVMRGMLEHWIRKGKLCKQAPCGGCVSSCGGCNPTFNEFYRWLGPAVRCG